MPTDQGLTDQSWAVGSDACLGHVLAVEGSEASVGLTSSVAGHSDRPTVGKFVAITGAGTTIVGIISRVSLSEAGSRAMARVDLIGEIERTDGGTRRFRRGVRDYAAIGDPVEMIRRDELGLIYASSSERAITVGHLSQDPSIPAYVDTDHRLAVSFEDAALGAVRSVSLPHRRKVELRVPAGVKSGQKLRIRTKSEIDGQDQEILFQVDVEKHSYFELHGVNVHLELPVSVDEAVLGAKIPVPTVEGPVLLRIPPGSNAGTIFRMRGKGAAVPESAKNGKTMRGDQFVSLKVVLPENNDKNFLRLIRKWASKNSYSVRDHFNIPSFAE